MGSIGLGDNKDMADLANQSDISTTGGGAGSAIFSKEQSDEIRRKAGEGRVIGMDDLNPRKYLGHFAGDDVMSQGHNTGAKSIGVAKGDQEIAKHGFRRIPGNANDGYVAKKVRKEIETMASAVGPYRYGGPIPTGPHGPMPGTDPKAPLRERDRAAKRAAGPGKGPLRHK